MRSPLTATLQVIKSNPTFLSQERWDYPNLCLTNYLFLAAFTASLKSFTGRMVNE